MKERHVVDFIRSWISTEKSLRKCCVRFDQQIDGGCSRRRPDIFIELLTHSLIVEIDEQQHNDADYCSCENKRMMQLYEDLGRRPLVFIRFNPDRYTTSNGKVKKSCFDVHNAIDVPVIADKNAWRKRLDVLKSRLIDYLHIIPDRALTVEHLFYDGFI